MENKFWASETFIGEIKKDAVRTYKIFATEKNGKKYAAVSEWRVDYKDGAVKPVGCQAYPIDVIDALCLHLQSAKTVGGVG